MSDFKTIALIKIWHGTSERGQPPMGLLFVGNSLKKAGYDVKIFHFSKFDALARLHEIEKTSPMLVGLSIITGDPADVVIEFCERLKERLPHVPIVFGGVHPTLEPVQCLEEKCVDYVVLNEGEKTIVLLADAVRDGGPLDHIEGLGYKDHGEIKIAPFKEFEKDLDKFNMDWGLIDIERYIWPSYSGIDRVLMGYVASRGCPHKCGFCYNQVFNKSRWRHHSAEKVVRDINRLSADHNINGVVFYDDNFTVNKKWALEILKGINVSGIHIETRIDYIREDFLDDLADRGVMSLFLGIESGSDRLLELISKGFSSSDIYRSLDMMKRYPFDLKLSFILGIPTETLTEFRKTLALIVWSLENLPHVGFTIGFYLPYPGTPLFDLCVTRGFMKPKTFSEWKILDRWGEHDMPLPWIEGNFLRPVEVKKLRILSGWMINLRKSNFTGRNLLYPIVKARFIFSGNIAVRAFSFIEDIVWVLLKAIIKKKER